MRLKRCSHELGLDKPFIFQYLDWLGRAVQGNFGFSYMVKKPVIEELIHSLPATVILAVASTVFMLIVSIPAGIYSAVKHNSWFDYMVRGLTFVGVSVPNFWMGLMLLWIFGLKLGLLPIVGGRVSAETLVLPALTLGIVMAAKYTRQVRATVLEELNQDYVVGARARGMSESHILWKEVLPNAMLPLITLLGLSFGNLLGGAAVVEIVFSWPGLGYLAVQSIIYRDFQLVQGIVLWIALMYMVINLIVDISYNHLDPRLERQVNNMQILINGLKTNRAFAVSSFFVLLLIVVALAAPLIAPYDPLETVMQNAYLPPSAEHLFGTDKLGRDNFSRILYGASYSLSSVLLLVTIIFAVGTTLGVLAGYYGGKVDIVIMRISDMMISFPGMILAIAVAGILGGSLINAIIALTIVTWTKYARLARSMVLKIKKRDFVEAAIVNGGTSTHILWKHILPNILPLMVITAASDIGAMMMELAGLSFLGFGSQPPAPEWGLMLNEGRQQLQTAPWLMIFPGLAIFVTVVIFNLWGDALRDVLDPRQEE